MTTLTEPAPVARPRRIALGPDRWIALHRAAGAAGIRLPADLAIEVDPADAALAEVDLEGEVDHAGEQLRRHGVLDEDGPVPAVGANLAALGAAGRRARVSLSGAEIARLGYLWVDARVGGSLVREGVRHTLSLFDARSIGEEVLALVPEAEHRDDAREPFAVPLDAVGPIAALDEIPEDLRDALGEFAGLSGEQVTRLHDWSARNRAVLHVTAVGPDRPARAMVWFLDRDGWWAGSTRSTPAGERELLLTPAGRAELAAALGALLTGAWQ